MLSPRPFHLRRLLPLLLALSGWALAGCEASPDAPGAQPGPTPGDNGPSNVRGDGANGDRDSGPPPAHPGIPIEGDDASEFVSHVPGRSQLVGLGGDGGLSAAPESAVGAFTDGASDRSAERAIAEADIIQREGSLLYALSRYAGLSIVDISEPTKLRLVGRYRTSATPFEMYLRDGVAYVMFNGYSTYVYDAAIGGYAWEDTARMQAIDVSDPTAPTLMGDHRVAGDISDSRLVGDILYLVTYQSGWCWGCEQQPSTRITSFDVSERDEFAQVDQIVFETEANSWGPRSVSATNQRMYVAGNAWDESAGEIDVIDISDPTGDLKHGTTLQIAGQVESRWQMDEYDGVLRVISQSSEWRTLDAPVLETFKVDSASQIEPLASLEMVLPRPEDLRSVRFDGNRAYAVTFEQTDPLFTFDLSNPALPLQVGELEIPGWLYHMEPRGDVLYALGYDPGVDGGALHVSRFDVSLLALPVMTARVNFGGDWGGFAEDQDRIHKAFNILEDEGLIMVPFSGGSYADERYCRWEYHSGIQLIDITAGGLLERGVAPQRGQARRAMWYAGRVFGVTDDSVQVFDIDDRDAPEEIGRLDVARNITAARVHGDRMIRFSRDWWTDETILDHIGLERVEEAQGDGSLDLSALATQNGCRGGDYWTGEMFVHGDHAYLPRRGYSYDDEGVYQQMLTIFVAHVPDDGDPQLVNSLEIESTPDTWVDRILLTDSALLVGRSSRQGHYDYTTRGWVDQHYAYDIYSLADPAAPALTERFELPAALASSGWGYMEVGCGMGDRWGYWYPGYGSGAAVVSGDVIASQHREAVDDGTGRVRYFLDRLDVSDPSQPRLLPQVNIPGNVVFYDHPTGRVASIDYDLTETPAKDWQACAELGARSYFFDEPSGICRTYHRRAHALVIEDGVAYRRSLLELEQERSVSGLGVSGERLMYVSNPPPNTEPGQEFALARSLRFDTDGRLYALQDVEVESRPYYWGSTLQVFGRYGVWSQSNSLEVLDTTDPTEPTYSTHELPGWYCRSLELHDGHAYCVSGRHGVLDVEL